MQGSGVLEQGECQPKRAGPTASAGATAITRIASATVATIRNIINAIITITVVAPDYCHSGLSLLIVLL